MALSRPARDWPPRPPHRCPPARQRLHKLGVKRRRLRIDRLVFLAVALNNAAIAPDTSSAGGPIPVVDAAAALLAAVTAEPILAKFPAAFTMRSGAAKTTPSVVLPLRERQHHLRGSSSLTARYPIAQGPLKSASIRWRRK